MTDIFCSVNICKSSLELSSLPKDVPPCISNPDNNFNSGIDRLRWCGPALVSDMGSDLVMTGLETVIVKASAPVEDVMETSDAPFASEDVQDRRLRSTSLADGGPLSPSEHA